MVRGGRGRRGEKKSLVRIFFSIRSSALALARSPALQDAFGALGALREAPRRIPPARPEPDRGGDRRSLRCDGPSFELLDSFVVVAVVEPATKGDGGLEGGHLFSGAPRRAVVREISEFFSFTACLLDAFGQLQWRRRRKRRGVMTTDEETELFAPSFETREFHPSNLSLSLSLSRHFLSST